MLLIQFSSSEKVTEVNIQFRDREIVILAACQLWFSSLPKAKFIYVYKSWSFQSCQFQASAIIAYYSRKYFLKDQDSLLKKYIVWLFWRNPVVWAFCRSLLAQHELWKIRLSTMCSQVHCFDYFSVRVCVGLFVWPCVYVLFTNEKNQGKEHLHMQLGLFCS